MWDDHRATLENILRTHRLGAAHMLWPLSAEQWLVAAEQTYCLLDHRCAKLDLIRTLTAPPEQAAAFAAALVLPLESLRAMEQALPGGPASPQEKPVAQPTAEVMIAGGLPFLRNVNAAAVQGWGVLYPQNTRRPLGGRADLHEPVRVNHVWLGLSREEAQALALQLVTRDDHDIVPESAATQLPDGQDAIGYFSR